MLGPGVPYEGRGLSGQNQQLGDQAQGPARPGAGPGRRPGDGRCAAGFGDTPRPRPPRDSAATSVICSPPRSSQPGPCSQPAGRPCSCAPCQGPGVGLSSGRNVSLCASPPVTRTFVPGSSPASLERSRASLDSLQRPRSASQTVWEYRARACRRLWGHEGRTSDSCRSRGAGGGRAPARTRQGQARRAHGSRRGLASHAEPASPPANSRAPSLI